MFSETVQRALEAKYFNREKKSLGWLRLWNAYLDRPIVDARTGKMINSRKHLLRGLGAAAVAFVDSLGLADEVSEESFVENFERYQIRLDVQGRDNLPAYDHYDARTQHPSKRLKRATAEHFGFPSWRLIGQHSIEELRLRLAPTLRERHVLGRVFLTRQGMPRKSRSELVVLAYLWATHRRRMAKRYVGGGGRRRYGLARKGLLVESEREVPSGE
jgi:hypothetical protein